MKRILLAAALAAMLIPINANAQCSGDRCTLDINSLSRSSDGCATCQDVPVSCGFLSRLFGRSNCSDGTCTIDPRSEEFETSPGPAPIPTALTAATQRLIHQATVGLRNDEPDTKFTNDPLTTGTIIAVGSKALILTVTHGFYEDGKVFVSYPHGFGVEGCIVARDAKHDLALIEAPAPAGIRPVTLGSSYFATKDLTHVGYELNGKLRMEGGEFQDWVSASHNTGMVKRVPSRSTDFYRLGKTQLAMTGNVAQAESGGGVYDIHGRLHGIVWGGKSGRVYATNVNQIVKFLGDNSDEVPVTAGRWSQAATKEKDATIKTSSGNYESASLDESESPFRPIEGLDEVQTQKVGFGHRRNVEVPIDLTKMKLELIEMMAIDDRFRGTNGTDGTDGNNGVPGVIDPETIVQLTEDITTTVTTAVVNKVSEAMPKIDIEAIAVAAAAKIDLDAIASKVSFDVDANAIAEAAAVKVLSSINFDDIAAKAAEKVEVTLDIVLIDEDTKQQIDSETIDLSGEELILKTAIKR